MAALNAEAVAVSDTDDIVTSLRFNNLAVLVPLQKHLIFQKM